MSLLKLSSAWIALNVYVISVQTNDLIPLALKDKADYDGPFEISGAPCKTSNPLIPIEDLEFYHNFVASMYYCVEEIKDLTCSLCQTYKSHVSYNIVFQNETSHTLAMVSILDQKKEIILCFRGSHNRFNFYEDFTYVQLLLTETISLHAGFYYAMMSLYDQFVAILAVQIQRYPDYRVRIIGHSLGGAMASLATFALIRNKRFPGVSYSLITYGQPRTGNKGFADYMNALGIPMARVTQAGDIVTHVPHTSIAVKTSVIGEYFVHHQTEYSLSRDFKGRYCSSVVYEDPTCGISYGPKYSVGDHLKYFNVNYKVCVLGRAQEAPRV